VVAHPVAKENRMKRRPRRPARTRTRAARLQILLFLLCLGTPGHEHVTTDPPRASAQAAKSTDAQVSAQAEVAAPKQSSLVLTFNEDAVGGSASGIESVIGDWRVEERDKARGLLVDGSRWRNGTPSSSLVDQARRLYGARYAEFLDSVKAFAFFPLAVVQRDAPQGDVRMSVRFLPLAGKIDQAAGIAFDIQPDGGYAVVRANALEDNILWAKVVRGKRTILDTIRNTPTPTRTWHKLVVTVRAHELSVELDDVARFRTKLERTPTGRVGLWSKADSQVLFDDFRVEKL
jgi:hypothetical protein